MLGLALLHFFVPMPGLAYVVLFNAVLLAMIATLLAVGVRWGDLKVLDLGGGALLLVLMSRYYDVAWGWFGPISFAGGAVGLGVVVLAALFLARRQAAGALRPRPAPARMPPA
jgi:hypothetical protein